MCAVSAHVHSCFELLVLYDVLRNYDDFFPYLLVFKCHVVQGTAG